MRGNKEGGCRRSGAPDIGRTELDGPVLNAGQGGAKGCRRDAFPGRCAYRGCGGDRSDGGGNDLIGAGGGGGLSMDDSSRGIAGGNDAGGQPSKLSDGVHLEEKMAVRAPPPRMTPTNTRATNTSANKRVPREAPGPRPRKPSDRRMASVFTGINAIPGDSSPLLHPMLSYRL